MQVEGTGIAGSFLVAAVVEGVDLLGNLRSIRPKAVLIGNGGADVLLQVIGSVRGNLLSGRRDC